MWIRLAKELRELAVPWAQAVALALAAAAFRPDKALWVFWLAATYLASRLFGAELDHRTLPRLLAQPISRARIWGEKMLAGAAATATGVAVVLAALAAGGAVPRGPGGTHAVAALVVLATAPTLSLWLRDSLRTFWASLALPANVYVAAIVVWTLASGAPQLPPFAAVFLPYGAVLLILGRRRFLRLELAADARREASSSGPEATARPIRGVASELVTKELRLQRTSLLLVPVAAGGGIAAWLLSFFPDLPIAGVGTLGEVLETVGLLPSALLIVLVPLLLGANAVASERQLGVLPWQLALPVPRRLQWRVKLAVCLALTLLAGLTGAVLAWLLASRLSPQAFAGSIPRLVLAGVACLAFGLYGSRLGRSPFHALGLALVFGAATWYVWNLARHSAAFAGLLWPADLGPFLDLGSGGLDGLATVDLLVLLLLFALAWALPRHELWLAGRGLIRSAGFGALAAVALAAVAVQIYLLNRTSLELEREIAAHDAQIERLGGIASLDWLAAELDLGVDRLEVDDLIHVVDFGYAASEPEQWDRYRSLRPEVSRFMDLASALDGIDASRRSIDLWFWGRALQEVLESSQASRGMKAEDMSYRALRRSVEWFPTSRSAPSPWSGFSIAPWWFQDHRRRQLDRRVRQNVLLEAMRMAASFERQLAAEPERFEALAGFRSEFFSPYYVRAGRRPASTTDG